MRRSRPPHEATTASPSSPAWAHSGKGCFTRVVSDRRPRRALAARPRRVDLRVLLFMRISSWRANRFAGRPESEQLAVIWLIWSQNYQRSLRCAGGRGDPPAPSGDPSRESRVHTRFRTYAFHVHTQCGTVPQEPHVETMLTQCVVTHSAGMRAPAQYDCGFPQVPTVLWLE